MLGVQPWQQVPIFTTTEAAHAALRGIGVFFLSALHLASAQLRKMVLSRRETPKSRAAATNIKLACVLAPDSKRRK
jgi:hypothetical protein